MPWWQKCIYKSEEYYHMQTIQLKAGELSNPFEDIKDISKQKGVGVTDSSHRTIICMSVTNIRKTSFSVWAAVALLSVTGDSTEENLSLLVG